MKTKIITIAGEKVLCVRLEVRAVLRKGDIYSEGGRNAPRLTRHPGEKIEYPFKNDFYRPIKRKPVKKAVKPQVKSVKAWGVCDTRNG